MIDPKPGDVLASGEDRVLVLQVTESWRPSLTYDPYEGFYETVIWTPEEPVAVLKKNMMPVADTWRIHWRPGKDGKKELVSTSPSTYPPLGWELKRL